MRFIGTGFIKIRLSQALKDLGVLTAGICQKSRVLYQVAKNVKPMTRYHLKDIHKNNRMK